MGGRFQQIIRRRQLQSDLPHGGAGLENKGWLGGLRMPPAGDARRGNFCISRARRRWHRAARQHVCCWSQWGCWFSCWKPIGHCRRHWRSSSCLLTRHTCNPLRLIGSWSAAPAFVCTFAMFPRAARDLNLLCFVSFHHHFLVFDFYLLIYFLGGMLLLHWLMFCARNLCNTIKGIILQRVFFFFSRQHVETSNWGTCNEVNDE